MGEDGRGEDARERRRNPGFLTQKWKDNGYFTRRESLIFLLSAAGLPVQIPIED